MNDILDVIDSGKKEQEKKKQDAEKLRLQQE